MKITQHFLLILICLATVLNGIAFWSQRTGTLNEEERNTLYNKRANLILGHLLFTGPHKNNYPDFEFTKYKHRVKVAKSNLVKSLYKLPSELFFTKVAKYVSILALVLYLTLNSLSNKKSFLTASTLTKLLLIYLIILALYSSLQNDPLILVSASIVYCFIAILFLNYYAANPISSELLASYFYGLLILLLAFCCYELFFGTKIFHTNSIFKKRLTGFFNQPNTMGVFVICSSIYIAANLPKNIEPLEKFIFIGPVLILLLFSDSQIALLCLPIVFLQFSQRSYIKALSIIGGLVFIIILFIPEAELILKSVAGRLNKFDYFLSYDSSIPQYLFGHGLGVISNTTHQLSNFLDIERSFFIFPADSTALLLFIETGLIGCVSFYLLLIYLAIKHQHYMLVYLTFILCSLTINIIELFPLNILLGLMMSQSLIYINNSKQSISHIQ